MAGLFYFVVSMYRDIEPRIKTIKKGQTVNMHHAIATPKS
jgi:hypothetical protein